MTTDTTTTSPEELREQMLGKVREMGHARSREVQQVLRETPRHAFVPDAELAAAYNPVQSVITHRFGDGRSLSCASAPYVVAMQLDQLEVRPGHRILELGAGTGYNAAMLAQLTGDGSLVTTVDIDADVTAQAVRNLAATSHTDVQVITGDGGLGYAENAPYDRLIATVSPWDISAQWWEQLAHGARVVVPLRWRGQARGLGLAYTDGRLVADSNELCGFVHLVNEEHGELNAVIAEEHSVKLHWDRDQNVNPDALGGVLEQPRTEAWSGVTIAGDEPYDGIWVRLTVTDPRVCRLDARHDVPRDVCQPVQAYRTPALVEGDSLAYLTMRRQETDGGARWELGAIGHGSLAYALAEHFCGELRAWSVERDAQIPSVTIYPADVPVEATGACAVIRKTHSTLVLSYER